jgi:hypothetical protein
MVNGFMKHVSEGMQRLLLLPHFLTPAGEAFSCVALGLTPQRLPIRPLIRSGPGSHCFKSCAVAAQRRMRESNHRVFWLPRALYSLTWDTNGALNCRNKMHTTLLFNICLCNKYSSADVGLTSCVNESIKVNI